VKTVAVVTEEEHVKALLAIAHLPLLEESVKPEPGLVSIDDSGTRGLLMVLPLVAAVIVAHVPDVYHVPALIMQPVCVPPLITFRKPLPDGDPEPPVGLEVGEVVVPVEPAVVVVDPPEAFGRYLIPEEGHVDPDPTGVAGWKVPL
jgi:hypothetical protein